jgi:hypothetical protein
MSTTRMRRRQTMTSTAVRIPMKMSIKRGANMGALRGLARREFSQFPG